LPKPGKQIMMHQLPSAPREGSFEHPESRGGMALFIVHLDAAYNLARWLMHDETEAEDMVQEAYVRVAIHFAGFRGGDGRAWLLTIVRNSCYDRLRQKGASDRHTDFDEELHSAGRQAPNPETALLLTERSEFVKKSLAELPSEYREVLILRELEQLSYRDIADIAGIPLGTVMSRISRARQQLQRTLFDLRNEGAVDVVLSAHTGLGRAAPDVMAP
jgi:RNA polymerase sigma-70 factor (ECF subfamily)